MGSSFIRPSLQNSNGTIDSEELREVMTTLGQAPSPQELIDMIHEV